MLEQYFKEIFKTTKAGDATEPSFYPALKRMIEEYAEQRKRKFAVTTLPKKTEGGNPDFRIWDGRSKVVGYMEAKDPSILNLNEVEESEQLKRYRKTFPNLILTNFFEFRLYRSGERILTVSVGRPFIIYKLKTIPPVEHREEFLELLERFFSFSIPKTTTAKALALELAKRTRFLRDNLILEESKEESIEGVQILESFYKSFKDHLVTSLTLKDFADLFAQTVTYGLFAARSRATDGFNRELAYKYVPRTIGVLHSIFRFISSADLPPSMKWIIDDIAEVLAETDVKNIIHSFSKEGRGRDPIVHFYETFLAEYDPKEREKRGVYYTPEAVVGYIVRSIHKLLKEKFGKEDGFADTSVTVLDPAAGTLTFPAEAIRQAVEEFKAKYGDGGVGRLIKEHVLKNFYAFELMMAPYAVGHLKIGFVLDELDYKLLENERFRLYLTNTLEFTEEDPNKFPGVFEQTIARESAEALKVKKSTPIVVVMGNPPYSGVSENKGEWILKQIEEYKHVDGKPLGEQKHWLQDDYVKFFRFAQWKIEQTGAGILGFITNHAWLDNPTFRGMRASLLKTFDEIYILNLHGSTLKKEKTPGGGKDENVFDIQPGVAITICVKQEGAKSKKSLYADRFGLREQKYEWLDKHDVESTKYQPLTPTSPYYFFVPREEKGREEYEQFPQMTEIFPVNSTGIVTARDHFVIDRDRSALEVRIRMFRDSSDDDDFIQQALKLKENYAWRVSKARQELKQVTDWEKYFKKILYRPFDERWIYYHPSVVWRTRDNVMQHMFRPNLALLAKRQQKQEFSYAFVSDKITESCVFESAYANNTVFPLYLYDDQKTRNTASLFSQPEASDLPTRANLNPEIVSNLENLWKRRFFWNEQREDSFQALDVFYYVYAVLYSNVYRKKYAEFLKTDFPRVPFTKDYKVFSRLADLGERLVGLHLLKVQPADNRNATQLQGRGETKVEKVEWRMNELWINEKQRFTPVPEEVWNYFIGGYQVLLKWLKDRKGRTLSSEEIKKYCRIVTSLKATIEIQEEIDELYPKVERTLL